MHTYISPPSLTYPPPSHLTHLGHHRASSWAAVEQLPASYIFYTWKCIYVIATLSIHPTLSFPLCVHQSVPYVYTSIQTLQSHWANNTFTFTLYICKLWKSAQSLVISPILVLFYLYQWTGFFLCFSLLLCDKLLFFSCSVMSDSFWPHGRQHASLPCPSLSPRACSNSCPLSWWGHPTISLFL